MVRMYPHPQAPPSFSMSVCQQLDYTHKSVSLYIYTQSSIFEISNDSNLHLRTQDLHMGVSDHICMRSAWRKHAHDYMKLHPYWRLVHGIIAVMVVALANSRSLTDWLGPSTGS